LEIEPEDIRRAYAEMSDEGLLSINRNDLTEPAQPYDDAEIGGRGLHDDCSRCGGSSSAPVSMSRVHSPLAGFHLPFAIYENTNVGSPPEGLTPRSPSPWKAPR
jgi:hypothetical protein